MLWQKSPQYQNMPHGEYMKTAEGQKSQQAFQDWDKWMQQSTQQAKKNSAGTAGQPMGDAMSYDQATGTYKPFTPQKNAASPGAFSAYAPGAAQPKAQAGGTAYNPSAGQPFSAWTPGGAATGMAQNQGGVKMPSQVSDWVQSQAGQYAGGGPPAMPPDVRKAYDQWYNEWYNDPNKGAYSGGSWDSGPVPGTTMYRPPVNDSPYGRPLGDALPPPPGAFGGQPSGRPPAQPGQRTPVTRPTPGRAPGQVSSYPAALPPSSQPYYDEVRKQFPDLNQFQAAEMANQVRAQQERQRLEITNPVAPMPAERTPEQMAAGRQQQRQREQELESRRQKARKQEARNNAQRMDPNWEQNQQRANAERVQKFARKQAEQKWEPSRPELQKRYWKHIAEGSSPEKARQTADQFL